MSKKLLVATRNSGKVREFTRLLSDFSFDVIGLVDRGIDAEIEETGTTFEENALIKARGYADISGELTLADDSGLVVDALDGEPGVMSARYGGKELNDEQRVELLLENMREEPGWKRTARFIAVLALVGRDVPNGYATSGGVLEGAITHEPIGHNGFGYDPVFWLTSQAKTAAELSGEGKDKLSHRGRAFEGLRRTLRSLE
jgi:XTP/dITP diphosphohydrolase